MVSTGMTRRGVLGVGLGLAAAPFVADAAVAATAPLRVGVLTDTSGPFAIHGKRQLLGIEFQAELVNAAAPGRVELLIADTKGDAAVTESEAARLIGEGVHALIGTSAEGTAAIVSAAGQAASIPTVMPMGGPLPTESFAFRSGPVLATSFRKMMESVAASGTLLARLQMDGLQSVAGDRLYEQQAAANGLVLVDRELFGADATDLRPRIAELLRGEPEIIEVSALPPFNGMAARDVHAIGWGGHVYFSAAAGHPGFFEVAGEGAEGAHLIAPWSLAWDRAPAELPNHAEMQAYGSAFEAAHGQLGTYVSYGADALGLLNAAFASTEDPVAARDALEALTYKGVTGVYTMSPDNHAGLDEAALTVLTARSGRWEPGA